MANVDRNIVALLREDTFTVQVSFDLQEPINPSKKLTEYMRMPTVRNEHGKTYTYICTLPVSIGDIVVVPGNDDITLARVFHVDSEVKIESDDNIRYKWVIDIVDMGRYRNLMQSNITIENAVRDSYQRAIKTGLRDRVLNEMASSDRSLVEGLLRPQLKGTNDGPSAEQDDSEGGVG